MTGGMMRAFRRHMLMQFAAIARIGRESRFGRHIGSFGS
jgi:hypothetical protein